MFRKHVVHNTIFLKDDHLFARHMRPKFLARAYTIVHVSGQIRHPMLVFVDHLGIQGDKMTMGEFFTDRARISGVAQNHEIVSLLTEKIHDIANDGLHQIVESRIDDDGDLVFFGVRDERRPRYVHELGMF